jgi:hypothetical protein
MSARAARPRLAAVTAAVVAAVAAVLLLAAAAPAQATGYRYWSYWLRSGGAWTYAQTGPAMHVPKDGDVEGWRFAVSKDAAAKAVQPRGAADFAAICAGTAPAAGHKRIALLVDPGTAADAPGGATPPAVRTVCARIPAAGSSADALAAVARPLRYDSAGILCAIAGYPANGCGEQVAAGPVTQSAGDGRTHGDGPAVGVYAGVAAVAALAGAAFWRSRRRTRP